MTAAARAFVAVVPPPAVLDAVEELVTATREHAGDGLRWSTRDRWHCTLQFLGPVADGDALVGAIEGVLRAVEPFAMQLSGAGAFPSPEHATVLWVGVAGDRELSDLATAVHRASAPLAFASEHRAFRPHVTVAARASSARDLSAAVAGLSRDGIGPSWTASEVVVFESDRGYHELARVTLGPHR